MVTVLPTGGCCNSSEVVVGCCTSAVVLTGRVVSVPVARPAAVDCVCDGFIMVPVAAVVVKHGGCEREPKLGAEDEDKPNIGSG